MKAPRWAMAVAITVCLPVAALPVLISMCAPQSTAETLLWLYPFAIFGGAFCAYKSMPERPEVFWVLIAVIILIHLSMWVLVDPMSVTALI